ncbi:MAG: molybdenum cofactor biosynthesis protein MoaE [Methylococcales bacterium]|nr:molybdenum cofactor biosynthesis protein MoaE [Methylococcales bacterium]
MSIILCEQPIEPWKELEAYQKNSTLLKGKYGACNIFTGVMRDFNQGDTVESMYLEHYPGMTELQLKHIAEQGMRQWSVLDCLIMHRVGAVAPNDTLVLVACWAVHRGDAFDACRFIMETLKTQAPFWKKETLATGRTRWVEKNSEGYQ